MERKLQQSVVRWPRIEPVACRRLSSRSASPGCHRCGSLLTGARVVSSSRKAAVRDRRRRTVSRRSCCVESRHRSARGYLRADTPADDRRTGIAGLYELPLGDCNEAAAPTHRRTAAELANDHRGQQAWSRQTFLNRLRRLRSRDQRCFVVFLRQA